MAERFWTLEEARSYLPRLRMLLAAIRRNVTVAAHARTNGHGPVVGSVPSVDAGPAGAGPADPGAADAGGGGPERGGMESSSTMDAATALAEIEDRGVVLRDVERGLVDFPARHRGRVVLLCWLAGEDDIGWWHWPEDGFAGRRPLPLPPDVE